jgi:glycosyltransferase involved in cell wall biosynthesis
MTIFTPSYNRAHTLPKLFESLRGQTMQDFEWVVVDDGSTDETPELIEDLAGRASFPVLYYRQENAGKHVATNRGVELASGAIFWTVDSDDWLLPDSVERMINHWFQVSDRPDFAAVTGLCQDPEGALVGSPLPAEVIDSNSLELTYRYGVRGDMSGFTRTSVMRDFPFPEGDFNHMPEGMVWNAIAEHFQTRYVNEPVLVVDYQPDGFTMGGTKVSPRGAADFQVDLLGKALPYLWRNPRDLVVVAANCSRFGFAAGDSPRRILGRAHRWRERLLILLTMPIGVGLRRLRDRM